MKTILLTTLLLFSFSCTYSQETIKINNIIYFYSDNKLYSSENKFKDENTRIKCPYFYVNNEIPFSDVVKKVFSKERINELGSNNQSISLVMICSKRGNVKEVTFKLRGKVKIGSKPNNETISYEEISKFEDEIKNYQFKLTNTCDNVENYTIHLLCNFNKILRSEQK
jgi:hypothetical protein